MKNRQESLEVERDFSWMEEDEGYLDPKELHQTSTINKIRNKNLQYSTINYKLFHIIGKDPTLLLCKLMECENYYSQNNMLQLDGSFYFTNDEGKFWLCCNKDSLLKYFNVLSDYGLLRTRRQVVPGKYENKPVRFVNLQQDNIVKLWKEATSKIQN